MITSSYDQTHVKQHPAQLYVLADKEKEEKNKKRRSCTEFIDMMCTKRVYQNIGEASQSHSQTVIV